MERVENIVGKGEIAGNQHFLLFPQFFQKAFSSRLLKGGIVWVGVKCWLNLFADALGPLFLEHDLYILV